MRKNLSYLLDKLAEWSLYILAFSIPFSKSMIEVSIVAALFFWATKKALTNDWRIKKTPLNALLVILFVANLISIVNSDFRPLVLRSLLTKCLKYLLLYFMVVETVDSGTKLKNLLKMAFISAVLVMIDAYLQYYVFHYDLFHLHPAFKYAPVTDRSKFPGIPTGPFPFPNDLSAWLVIILMPVLYLFVWDMRLKRSRYMLAAFLAPFLFLYYMANTRSSWFAFFVSFSLTLFIKKQGAIIVIILLIALVSLPLLPKQKLTDALGLRSMHDRLYMWRIGWKIFSEHPIVGNGLNTSFLKFKEFREDEYKDQRGSYVHNGYLQIAADTGILGLAVFLLILGRAFVAIFGYIQRCAQPFYGTLALGLGAGLLAFLIHAFFDTNLQSLPLVALFWFCLALTMGLELHHEG